MLLMSVFLGSTPNSSGRVLQLCRPFVKLCMKQPTGLVHPHDPHPRPLTPTTTGQRPIRSQEASGIQAPWKVMVSTLGIPGSRDVSLTEGANPRLSPLGDDLRNPAGLSLPQACLGCKTNIPPSNPTSGCVFKVSENKDPNRHLSPHVHSSFIHRSQRRK